MKPQYIDAGISDQCFLSVKQIDKPYLDKPFHFHPNCELVFIEEGHGKRIIGDNVSNFNEGDIVLMGPNLPHIWINDGVYYNGEEKLRTKATVIYFSPKLLENFLDKPALKPFQTLVNKAKRGIALKGEIKKDALKRLIALPQQDKLSQLISFLSILNTLINTKELKYLSGEKFINIYNEKDVDRINNVYQFLMKNFEHDILLDQVAAIANMAPTAFCRFFKEHTGKTLSKFLNELRIQHACDLLLNPNKSIADVCYGSGFNNLTNFNKFFKTIVGQTPTVYRQSINDN